MLSIDPKPKAVRSYSFSGYRSGPPEEPRGRWEKAAGGCLAGTSFRGTFPDAGETFCRVSTQSRRMSGATLFRVIAAGRLGSLTIGGKRQPEVVWPERLFGVHLRRLERLFAQYRSKVEGCLKLHFFGLSQRAAGEIFRKGLTKSRRLSGGNIFSGYRNGPFGEPRDRWEKAAGGCLAGTSFRGTSPKAGDTFCSV